HPCYLLFPYTTLFRSDAKKVMVVTDGVFSMDGDIAPLPEIVALAEEYAAFVMVDDAHSSGVLGKNGRGSISHFGLDGRVALQVGDRKSTRLNSSHVSI